jgi:hypothetical protein
MRLILIGALGLCACFPKPTILINDSAYPSGYFHEVWAETENAARVDIKLDGFLVHVYGEDKAAFDRACPEPEGLGCTNATSKISILAPVGTNAVEVGATVAHMLGHVALEQHGGDPDWSHEHQEWFGPGGVVEQIQALILEEASHGEG